MVSSSPERTTASTASASRIRAPGGGNGVTITTTTSSGPPRPGGAAGAAVARMQVGAAGILHGLPGAGGHVRHVLAGGDHPGPGPLQVGQQLPARFPVDATAQPGDQRGGVL